MVHAGIAAAISANTVIGKQPARFVVQPIVSTEGRSISARNAEGQGYASTADRNMSARNAEVQGYASMAMSGLDVNNAGKWELEGLLFANTA